MVTEQREAARANLSQVCEQEIKQLLEGNKGQIQRLNSDLEEHKQRLVTEIDVKGKMYTQNIVAMEEKQREKLEKLKEAMEKSVEEWEITEEKRRNEEVERYKSDLEGKMNAQIEEIARKLERENDGEVKKRREEMENELENARKTVQNLQGKIAKIQEIPPKSTQKPEIPPIVPISTVENCSQTVTFLPDFSDLPTKITEFDKTNSEECSQLENGILQLILSANTEEIELETKTMRMERWKGELERMAEELQREIR